MGVKIKNIIEDLSKFYKDVEIFFKIGKSKTVFFSRGTGFESSLLEERGIAIRSWKDDGSEYFFHSSDENSGRLEKTLLGRLKDLSYQSREDCRPHIAEREISSPNLDIFCNETAQASIDQLYDLFSKTINYLEEKWDGLIKVNSGELRAGLSENRLSNSRGFSGSFQRTMASIALNFQIRSRNQEEKTSFSNIYQNFHITFADSSILKIDFSKVFKDFENISGKDIVVSPQKLKEKEEKDFKVVFSPRASSELLRSFLEFLEDAQDYPFAISDKLTIVDDARFKGGLGSSPFDGVGFPSKKTPIIQNGRLVHWLENIIRPSYRDYPRVGPTNFYIKAGRKSQEEIIKHVASGAFIISLKAFKNAENESRSSLLGQGFLIEGGRISPCMGKFIISTEVENIFKNILEIGDDLQFIPWSGAFGSPTLLTEKIQLIPAL